jgi:RimJ/RimL family protein N-acetyltransferase
MKPFIETDRLLLREITLSDVEGFWELDSDPEVHQFLGNQPVTNKEQCVEMINFIRKQYLENGIGRWAVILKSTNQFIGWAGFKLIKEETNGHINYYDLGYRLLKQFWGQGYATEAAIALVNYGFKNLNLNEVIAIADTRNISSINVMKKAGLKFIGKFMHYNTEHVWFEITKEEWRNKEAFPYDY